MSWIIVSNRLPFKKDSKTGELSPSSGGLVSAVTGIKGDNEKIWVGIAPDGMTEDEWEQLPENIKKSYKPIFISPELYDKYYNKISNDVLWPLFHYEGSLIHFTWEDWEAYLEVNRKIAEAIAEISNENDLVWIHDFHLFMVPKFLRSLKENLKIGFFLHIPFPSSEVFRQLPVRNEILHGLLKSDLIGFHDYSYLRHFCNAIQYILSVDTNMLSVTYKGRKTNLGVFPVSIDTQKFINASNSGDVHEIFVKYQKQKNYKYLILGVDRLDYIKGIANKLNTFREVLRNYEELRGEVSLLQIAVPTRQDVDEYIRLKSQIESLVGEINGEFGKPNYTPVQYIYSSVDFNELVALYKLSDALLVTSRRDGMNLVALEYIASQDELNPGVVVLSEFAGAISILSHAISINPWDIGDTAEKIYISLKMKNNERIHRNKQMLEYLKTYTATNWAETFMDNLIKSGNEYETEKQEVLNIEESKLTDNIRKLKETQNIIFLDYDGTLVSIKDKPEQAIIQTQTSDILNKITTNPKNNVIIVSGRPQDFLMEQFKNIDVSLASEHGAKYFDKNQRKWISLVMSNKDSWFSVAEKIMNDYSLRVPESFVEVKEYAIAWHYRLSPRHFAKYQAKKLKEELEVGLSNLPVTIISGNKVIEARAIEANKGYFVRWFLEKIKNIENSEIIVIGDDATDEDMFYALNNKGITIKVGKGNTNAKYRLRSPEEVIKFLEFLS